MAIVSDKHKCIFIHIKKTAGISISTALLELMGYDTYIYHNENSEALQPAQATIHVDRHCSSIQLREMIPEKFENYYKFAFVRNPWERIHSLYKHLARRGNPVEIAMHPNDNTKARSFTYCLTNTKLLFHKPQTYYITENGKIIVDFVGRFENLSKDFKHVCDVLGVKKTLPELNRDPTHSNYANAYTERTEKIIRNVYAEEIEMFGYEFGN